MIHVPLILTITRLVSIFILAPVLVIFLPGASIVHQLILTFVFVIIASTDLFDGIFARAYGQVSDFGRVLDPIADKFFIMGSLIALLAINRIPFFVVFLLIMRELLVMAVRLLAAECGIIVHVCSWARLKTWVHTLLVTCAISPLALCSTRLCLCVWSMLFFASVILSWYSAGVYFVYFMRGIKEL